MDTRNRSIRLSALAFGVFGFAAALTAYAAPQCEHCLAGYYACRSNSPGDTQPCLEAMWDCETASGCAMSYPPD
ncbi:hypothetical protein [Lysobacter sp. ESA13C]|uniref:hypothetical protein n=1 Tax=unclassified Lysobacter TaxID=2635362 RepID=UPI001CBB12F5|nr:hypothetical protein [Lysobacter sp. ESA13C]